MAKRRKVFGRQIRQGYSLLSFVNTLSVFLTGDPVKILKHIMRKRAHKKVGKWLR